MTLSNSYNTISYQESRDIRAKIIKDSRKICRIAKINQSDAIKELESRGVFITYINGKRIITVDARKKDDNI